MWRRKRCENLSGRPSLSLAVEKLQEARLVIDQFGLRGHDSTSQGAKETGIEQARLSDKLTVLINDIGIAMKKIRSLWWKSI